jgi:phosphohistidine phosphatase SixA
MKLLLVRHGSRVHGSDNPTPLTERGREEVRDLAKALDELGIVPSSYLTSTKDHSSETATLLCEEISGGATAHVTEISQLDKMRPPLEVFKVARATGALHEGEATVMVGHEPSLGQLLIAFTSARHRPLAHGEAVCLSAATAHELLKGNGKVDFRWPVADYQERELREKIRSKVSVATFLAGFTFTALTAVLSRSVSLSWYDAVAIIALTFSLALFVACIYIYDSLSMPEGYWFYGERSLLHEFAIHNLGSLTNAHALLWRTRSERKGEARDATLRRHGPLYAYMVSTWTILFTPAVLFGLIGFAGLLLSSHRILIDVGAGVGILLVTVLYLAARPDLGYD